MTDHGRATYGAKRVGACPAEADLRRFDRLDLDPAELEQMADHIASCPRCSLLLEQANSEQAEVLASLLTPGDRLAEEPAYSDAERALLESPQTVGEGALVAAESALDADGWPATSQEARSIGHYEILRELGRGGMGIVFRARHLNLKRDAAVKILPPELMARPSVVERFYREMETIGQLHDPHIVHAYDAGEWNGIHYLAMEFVDGMDVARLCRAIGPLAMEDACEIVCQAARGLETVRRHHMVHRDIKPSNLIVTRGGRVKLLDLGLASMRAEGGDVSQHETAVGTIDYMAPEQWQCDPSIDIRADLYGLGCTIYTLLTGRPPFAKVPSDGVSKMQAHLAAPPPGLTDRRADVPHEVAAFALRLLAKNPDDRPSRPSEVQQALGPFRHGSNLAALVARAKPQAADTLVGAGLTTTFAAEAPPQQRGRPKQKMVRWMGVGAACLLAASLIAYSFRDRALPSPLSRGNDPAVERGQPPTSQMASVLDVAPLRTLTGHNDTVRAVAISADGSEILTASYDRTVGVWDAKSGELRRQFFGHADEVWDVAFRPGTRQAASAGKDGTVRLWDLDSGDELHQFNAHEVQAASVSFSRDGNRMLTAGMDNMVRVWNVRTRELERTLTGHLTWVRDAHFLPNERYAIACDNATMGVLWDLETGRMHQIYVGHNTILSSIRTSADGRYAASSSWDEMIRIWDVERAVSLQVLHRNMKPVRQVEFVGDTYYLLSASEDQKARLWNPFSARVLAEFSGHDDIVFDVAGHAQSGIVVTASADRTAKIWPLPPLAEPPIPEQLPAPLDLAAEAAALAIDVERPIREWQASQEKLLAVAAHPDGTLLATGGDDGVVRTWSVSSGELVQEVAAPGGGVLAVAWSHDGDRLAASSKDGNIYLWHLSTEEPPLVLAGHTGWVTGVAFRDDDAELITAGFDGMVATWALPTGDLNKQIDVSDAWIHEAHYWLNGENIFAVAYGMDHNPRVADLSQGTMIGQFGTRPFSHILACGEISPDGRTIAAGGWRATLQLVNVETDQPIAELKGHGGPIYDLHWEPDSRQVITASGDGTLRQWDVVAKHETRRLVADRSGLRGFVVLPESALIAAVSETGHVLLFRHERAGAASTAAPMD